jgi:hypothetical protein
VQGFSLGNLKPVYVPIGALDAENLAITAFTTRRNEARPEQRQAFVQVANFTDDARQATVTLKLEGQFLDAREIDVPANDSASVVFPLGAVPAGGLVAELKYDLERDEARDALMQDDVGYAALNEGGSGKVLLATPRNVGLELALETERAGRLANVKIVRPNVLDTAEYEREVETGVYDLVIFDQCVPAKLPRANAVFVGRLPPGQAWLGSEDAGDAQREDGEEMEAEVGQLAVEPQIIDWDRAHPLLAHVELGDVQIADSLVLAPPLAASVLIDSTAGPIAAVAPRDSYQDVVLGFEIVGQDENGATTVNTNWPLRHSFPTFWLNVVEYLAGGSEEREAENVQPGRPIELRVPGAAQELAVVDPTGKQTVLRRGEQDVVQFHDTDMPGVYQVVAAGQVVRRFAVNLFDREESNVRVRPTQDPESQTVRAADIRIGHVDVAAAVGRAPSRRELWKALLWGALFVLLLEWYIYNRRVYI